MALPEIFERIYLETEDTVRARLLAAIPARWATVEGSFPRDMIEVDVLEFTRMWEELNRYLSYMFIQYAYGSLLDAHGQNYGTPRKQGTTASGVVRFTAPEGTAINLATLVGAPTTDPDEPRAIYQTTNGSSVIVPEAGYVDLAVISLEPGAAQNQAAGAVTLLESPEVVGVESLTNPAPITGGSDPETDSDYRTRLIAQAELPVGSGTRSDYIAWALEKPGISDVAVEPLWDTSGPTPGIYDGRQNGSVQISLRGPSFVAVDWSDLEEVQRYIDPSRQTIALMEEGEPWVLASGVHTTLDWEKTVVQAGASALRLVTGEADTAVAALVRSMDLSHFRSGGEKSSLGNPSVGSFYLWIKSSNWAKVANTSKLLFISSEGNNYEVAMKTKASEGEAKPESGSEWWLWIVEKGQCTAVGAPDWSNITEVRISQVTTGAATQYYDYFTIRDPIGGAGEGRAPIGAAVTVVTPVPLNIDVSIQLTPLPGYSISGAPGTANLTELLRNSLTTYFQSLKPGEPVLLSKLENAINDTPGISDFLLEAPGGTTTLAKAVTLPAATLEVASTTGFLSAGTFYLGNQLVSYTGVTATTFTGCTGGAGEQAIDSVIRQVSLPVTMAQYPVLNELTLTS